MSFMSAVFYITFFSDPVDIAPGKRSHTINRQAFYLDGVTTPWEEMEERLAYWADHLEPNYGQIDWVSGRSGADVKIFGCNCFTPPDKQNHMIEVWRRIFHQSEPDCVLGPVCAVSARTIGPMEMLEKTHQAYEHQQAQQLRDTLNTHIRTAGTATPSKKI